MKPEDPITWLHTLGGGNSHRPSPKEPVLGVFKRRGRGSKVYIRVTDPRSSYDGREFWVSGRSITPREA